MCPHEVKSERGLRYHMQLHKEWGEEADDIEEVKESDEVMEARPEHSEEIGNVDIDQSEGVVTDTEQCDRRIHLFISLMRKLMFSLKLTSQIFFRMF